MSFIRHLFGAAVVTSTPACTRKVTRAHRHGSSAAVRSVCVLRTMQCPQVNAASLLRLSRPSRGGSARGESLRAISSARLCASLHLHLRPINVVVCDDPQGDLILRTASCLDAFSAYPFPTWLPSGAPGGTTGGPEVGPARSSRTSASTAQISNAHDR